MPGCHIPLEDPPNPSARLPPYPESLSSIADKAAACEGAGPDPTVMYSGRGGGRLL